MPVSINKAEMFKYCMHASEANPLMFSEFFCHVHEVFSYSSCTDRKWTSFRNPLLNGSIKKTDGKK